jgi:hypothetical protein
VLVGTAAAALWWWRESWPAGQAWPVSMDASASQQISAPLALGHPLLMDARTSAEIAIARIGEMRIAPDSQITLTETTSKRHRVNLDRGSISVRVWAPPARFGVRTPAGNVIDLGCVFDLNVDRTGLTRLDVQTGWVQLENGWGESLIPAGASATMAAATRPSVPVYRDADSRFSTRIQEFERAGDDAARLSLVPAIAASARPRDVITLLMLANQSSSDVKRDLLTRAAALSPPPSEVTIDQILSDRSRLWIWYDALDLPPAKSWWRNWRDAFPHPWR